MALSVARRERINGACGRLIGKISGRVCACSIAAEALKENRLEAEARMQIISITLNSNK
jgi:hypothetical protein